MKKNVVIVPTYNERDNIGNIIKEVFQIVPDVSILVVDDNSPDLTHEVVRDLQKKFSNLDLLVREKKNGLGEAYIEAFKTILDIEELEKVVMMDADSSHNPIYLPQFLETAKNFDVVVGSRYVAGGATVGWEKWRRYLSRFGNIYARFITGMPIFDCTGGFNLIDIDFLKKIDWTKIDMSGYAFQIELKYLLWRAGANFKEIPIVFKNRLNGESKISGHIINEGILAPWKIKMKKV